MNIGVLDYSQPAWAKPSQFTTEEGASYLVACMAAERISRRCIRTFDPKSSFRSLRPGRSTNPNNKISKLAPVEIGNVKVTKLARRSMSRIRTSIGTFYIPMADTKVFFTNFYAGL